MNGQVNLLSVDCEEWFVAEALVTHFGRNKWDKLKSTVEKNSHRLLEAVG